MGVRCLIGVVVALVALAALAGCGGSADRVASTQARDGERPSISGGAGDVGSVRAEAEASVAQVDYYGWKAFKLTNGLVTAVVVPEIGGRIMEYKLGAHPFLWSNPAEYGKRYDSPRNKAERVWRNFGGYKVWPAPQSEWGGPPDPLGSTLDGGRWEGKALTKSGPSVTVELTSPADATVTGLQITRRVTMYAGTTRLQVRESFKNVSKREVTWSIWTITQVPGALQPGVKASPQAKVYFPLDPKSKQRDGFTVFSGADTKQWRKIAGGKVLEASYAGKVAKIGADSDGGWIASVDDLHGFTFAQVFEPASGNYPDSGSSVELYTNGTDLPYMEMEVLSPLHKIAPDGEFTSETNWYCAKLGGPVVKATDVAAIKTSPSGARKGTLLTVTGELAVFAPGAIELEFTGEVGKTLGASNPVQVSPASGGAIRVTGTIPEGAQHAFLVLADARGQKVGNVAEVPLTTGLAKAP